MFQVARGCRGFSWGAVVVAGLWAVSGDLSAHPPAPSQGVDLEVVVDGVVQPKQRRGDHYFLPVRDLGSEYVLRVRNHLPRRIEAVISVDGLSVINGRQASTSIRGYLVGAHQTVEIPGWRRGDSEVAAFTFTREHDSYAARTGRPHGIGVIRLQAFEERTHRHYHPLPIRPVPLSEADSAPAAKRFAEASQANRGAADGYGSSARPIYHERIGTGYGRELEHHVSHVPFERSGVMHTVAIHYGRTHPHYRPHHGSDNFTPPPP